MIEKLQRLLNLRDEAYNDVNRRIAEMFPNITGTIKELMHNFDMYWVDVSVLDEPECVIFECAVEFKPGDDLAILAAYDETVLEATEPGIRQVKFVFPVDMIELEQSELVGIVRGHLFNQTARRGDIPLDQWELLNSTDLGVAQ